MTLGIQEIAFLIITILFGVLLGLFIIQTTKRKRSATSLVISLTFGFSACVAAIFSYTLGGIQETAFQALQLNLFGFQLFFFFVFFERLRSKDIHTGRLSVMLGLLFLQTFGLWLRVYFHNVGEIQKTFWFLSDMGYTLAGIFVYIVFSVPIYVTTYKYTHEKKPLIIVSALGLVGVGFCFSFLADLFDFLDYKVSWLGPIADYTIAIQALGLFIFVIIYITDINYIYRLPNDVFMLMVVTKAGLPLHRVKLKTRREVVIEGDLLSGLLSAINNVFEEIFKTHATIHNISSKEIHLLMEPGKWIVSVVISDQISYFLTKALKRYTRAFEERFSKELKERIQDVSTYQDAIDLIKPIFPFFIVDKIII